MSNNKNLRFNLKNSSPFRRNPHNLEEIEKQYYDQEYNKKGNDTGACIYNQTEFSFHNDTGTPLTSSFNIKCNNTIPNIEEENTKIKREAKDLIAKTKKMIEQLDMDKIGGKQNNNNNSSIKNTRQPHTERSHSPVDKLDKQNLSMSSLNKHAIGMDRSLSKDKSNTHAHNISLMGYGSGTNLQDDEIFLKNHLNFNIKTMTQRLLEKSKQVKTLEKELKEKTSQLDKMHEKLEKKNEEITKLNEALTVQINKNNFNI
jgi:hypothetical protein